MLKKLSGPVLILGSQITNLDSDESEIDERVADLFPYNIDIKPPEDESHLVSWKSQLEEDMKMIQCQDNRNHIIEVLAANDVECDDLGSICVDDTLVISKYIEEIVVSAISYHLMNCEHEYRNGKLLISSKRCAILLLLFTPCPPRLIWVVSRCSSFLVYCCTILQFVPWAERVSGRQVSWQRHFKAGIAS